MPHKGLYGKAKGVAKGAAKATTKAIGGKPTPTLGQVISVARRYNPVTGPAGAIRKVTAALKAKPRK